MLSCVENEKKFYNLFLKLQYDVDVYLFLQYVSIKDINAISEQVMF